MLNKIFICIMLSSYLSNLVFSQQNNSFNFQTIGTNEDFVTITSNAQLQPSAGMTLEAWVKPTEDPATYDRNGIISYFTLDGPTTESGFAFIYTGGKWRFVVITADDEDVFPQLASWPGVDIPYDGDTWTHIAGTYDGANARIFKNGVLEESYSAANVGGAIVWEDINTDFYIGKYLDNNKAFKGSIDEVRLWNIAKLDNEIQASMNNIVDVDAPGLIGYWKFDENQSTTIVDYAEGSASPGQSPGTLTDNGNGDWDTDVFAPTQCYDLELTEADFPYNHLADLGQSTDDWNFSNMVNDAGSGLTSGNGNDYTYKLTLSQAAIIYVTTCDVLTTVDIQIGVFTDDCDISSWFLFQDDSNGNIYEPDTSYQFSFDCISGFPTNPTYANMLPRLELDAGTYYITVCDYSPGNTVNATAKTWFGYSLIVDSTNLASDLNSVNYYFNQTVYGGDYPDVYAGNGTGLETADFSISVTPNGGTATSASFPSITNLLGAGLSGGETSVKLNISYNNPPSGTEYAIIKPASVSSVFNGIGVPLLNVGGIQFDLQDLVPPVTTFNPTNGDTLLPTDPIIITFSERIYLAPTGADLDNDNIDASFSLAYTDGAQEAIAFNAVIDPADLQVTITPNSNLTELRTAQVIISNNAFQDGGQNKVGLTNSSFLVADVTLPIVDSAFINSDNSYSNFYFSEAIYTLGNGSGILLPEDFVISFTTAANTTSATISSITQTNGNALAGGELNARLYFSYDNPSSGTEVMTVGPVTSQIFDGFGNAMNATANVQTFNLNDILVPSVSFDPLDGSSDLLPNGNITITFSEAIFLAPAGGNPNNDNIDAFFSLAYTDGDQESIDFDAQINAGKTVITLNPDNNLTEQRQVRMGFGGNLFSDQNNNTISASYSLDYTVKDITPPTVVSSSIALANAYILFNISEGIFTNIEGTGAVEPGDFSVVFNTNGGNATSMSIISTTNADGLILVGGESIIRLGISFDNPPSGVETAVVSPAGIYDQGGNVLDPADSGQSFSFYDQLSPSLTIATNPQAIDGLVYPHIDFLLTYSEVVKNSSNTSPDAAQIAEITSLNYLDGAQENILFSGSINAANNIITIRPNADMEEWRPIGITIINGLQDTMGNTAFGSSANYQTRDITPPGTQNSILDSANTGINILFSEGLFSTENESGGLTGSDFEIIGFSKNGGNADTVIINSLTSFSGVPLIGGEVEIRINITPNNTAAGTETFNVRPAAGSVFDRGGNLLDPSGNTQSFTLFDLLSPTVSFDPAPDSLIYPSETFILTFSEPVVKLDSSAVTNTNLELMVQLKYTSDAVEDIQFQASINAIKTVVTITPATELDQQRSLRVSFDSVFMDGSGNLVAPIGSNYTVRDITAPIIDSANYAIDNTHITVLVSEGVYGDTSATAGLDTSDFEITFQSNGGSAQQVSIESITNTSGTQLIGGESAIQVNLLVTGSPDGNETVVVSVRDNAIFDHVGNVMNSSQTTTRFSLTPAPIVLSSTLSADNTFLQLNFNENIFSTHDADEFVGIQDFMLEYNSNDGNCAELTINSITNTSNGSLNNGEDSIRVNFILSAIPSGVETFTLSPVDDEAVFNILGVYMDPQTVLGPYTLFDLLIPTFSLNIGNGAQNISNDTNMVITFSEPVRNINNSGFNNANIDDRITLFNLTDSIDVAFNASIDSSKTIISVIPVDTFKSEHRIRLIMDNLFEDLADNPINGDTTVIFTIRDYIAPAFDSVIIAEDNSFMDIFFSDQIFSSDSSIGALELDDLNIQFVSNGGNATQINLIEIQTLAGNNLVGGETIIRLIMEFDNSASGKEYIILKPATATSLYDESGNVMAVDISTDTLYLNDILVPTIDTLNIWQGDYVGINESTNIGLVFSEPIDSINYTLTSRRDTSFSFDAVLTPDSLELILHPPLVSLDTIDLVIASLIDTTGLSTVAISYRFLTPALGDYNTPPNDTISLEDLNNFIQAWNNDEFSRELGPVTGEFPHFKLYPDGKFGLDDGMIFTQMWRWSLKRFGIIEIARQIEGSKPDFSVNDWTVNIFPPLKTHSGQVIVRYNKDECVVVLQNSISSKKGILVSSADLIPGNLLIEYGYRKENRSPIELKLTEMNAYYSRIDIQYSFMDQNGILISQGDSTIDFNQVPESFELYQNFPNPFNSSTTIRYELPLPSEVQINIFDITGRLIKTLIDREFQAGSFIIDWNGEDSRNEKVSSGVYFYRIDAGGFSKSIKMILIK